MRHPRIWVTIFVLTGVMGIYLSHAELGRSVATKPEAAAEVPAAAGTMISVTRGPLSVWSVYDGHVEARDVVSISSQMGGGAVLVYLAPDGANVKKGEVLARFDSTDAERDVVKLNQDYQTARSELQSLEKAELPIERHDIELDVAEQQNKVKFEDKFIRDSQDLVKQGLMSDEEFAQEQLEADKERKKLEMLQSKLDLTTQYLEPMKVEQARTKMLAAEQALSIGKRQLANTTLTAADAGVVEYRSVNIGGEYRPVRVGDTVFQNQPFMSLPDPRHLVAHCEVPESEFDHVPASALAMVRPVARPDLEFRGSVESVGNVARTVSDQPNWQRYFETTIALREGMGQMKPGMSVTVNVLSFHSDDAVLLPRQALRWDNGEPYVITKGLMGRMRHAVRLGRANATEYQVLEGLDAGDQVLLP